MTEQLQIDFDKIIKSSNFSEKDIELKKKFLKKFIEKEVFQIENKKIGNF